VSAEALEATLTVSTYDEVGIEVETYTSWLTGWKYRKAHTIVGSTAGAVTDYQIRITVHYGSGTDSGEHVYLNGKCRTDFGDIRFTESDGVTELPYWIEEKVDGNYAIIWVKVPSIPAYPNGTVIYIYYGNPDATTTSNGDATFLYWNDFEGETVGSPPSDMTVKSGSWTVVTVDGNKVLKGVVPASGGGGEISLNMAVIPDIALHFKYRYGGGSARFGGVPRFVDDNNQVKVGEVYGNDCFDIYERVNGTWYRRAGTAFTYGTVWRSVVIKVYGTKCYASVDGVTIQYTNLSITSSKEVRLSVWNTSSATYQYFDTVFVRKFIDPEPSHGSWSSEETLKTPTTTTLEVIPL